MIINRTYFIPFPYSDSNFLCGFSIAESAAQIGIYPNALDKRIKRNTIEHVKVDGRPYVTDRAIAFEIAFKRMRIVDKPEIINANAYEVKYSIAPPRIFYSSTMLAHFIEKAPVPEITVAKKTVPIKCWRKEQIPTEYLIKNEILCIMTACIEPKTIFFVHVWDNSKGKETRYEKVLKSIEEWNEIKKAFQKNKDKFLSYFPVF